MAFERYYQGFNDRFYANSLSDPELLREVRNLWYFIWEQGERQRAFLSNYQYRDLGPMFYADFMNSILPSNRVIINQSTINRFRGSDANNPLLLYSQIFDIRNDVPRSSFLPVTQQHLNTHHWEGMTGNDSIIPTINSPANLSDVSESTVSQYKEILEVINEAAREASPTSTPILSVEEREAWARVFLQS